MDELQAILFFDRGKLLWAEQVNAEERLRVVSDFAVWLLDIALPFLPQDEHRRLAQQVQQLHFDRANQVPIDAVAWEQSRASCLAASKLWPAEWMCIGAIPGMPGMGHGVTAASLGIARGAREISDNHRPMSSAHSQLQKLLLQLEKPWFSRPFWDTWKRVLHHRIDVACLLYREPRSAEELALQTAARCGGDLGPYCDWLTDGGDSAHQTVREWLEWTNDSTSFSPLPAAGRGEPEEK